MSAERIFCLFCGVSKAQVIAVRNREHYTLGCGIESNTEAGFDYEELSPRHRWSDWTDRELEKQNIAPEFYDQYRRSSIFELQYASCEHLLSGHRYILDAETAELLGLEVGTCLSCGKKRLNPEVTWTWTCTACGWEASGDSKQETEQRFIQHAQESHPKATIVSTVLP